MNFSLKNLNILKYADKKTLQKSGILIVVILIFVMIFLMPAVKNNKKLREKCVEVENNIIRTIKKIEDLPQLERQKDDTEQYVKEVMGRLLEVRDKTQLIGDVSDIAKQTEVTITSMKPYPYEHALPESFLTYMKPLSYELLLECGYHQFGTFINKLENYDIILNVDEFHIEPKEDDEKTHRIKLILSTYAKIS